MKSIKNNVHGTKTISWDILKTYEFNDLKEKENRDISKLKNSIINDNFSFPFYLWKDHNYIIDGNGRNLALQELEAEGYKIPELPIVEIEANTKQHAKKLVLLASSNYGKVTKESYDLFIEDIDLELDDIELKIEDIGFSSNDIDYSDKNKEIDVKSFEEKINLTFKFSLDEYNLITQKLRELADTPEEALCKLLGID